MGNREAPVANMRFLLAVAVLTVVGAHAASDIVVKVDEEELSPLLRTFCCGSVQQRCARACTGRSCSLRCQGYCGVYNSSWNYSSWNHSSWNHSSWNHSCWNHSSWNHSS